MRRPLSRPPGRRNPAARLVPEICAGGVYVTWFTAALLLYDESHPLMIGALFAYGAAGLVLLVVPAVLMSTTLAFERDRGTMESLVLTPGNHAALGRGRFWHAAWPWLRFMLWLVPLYIVQAAAGVGSLRTANMEEFLAVSVAYVFAPKVYMLPIVGMGMTRTAEIPCWGAVLMLGRIAKDTIDMAVGMGIAYYLSARMRRGGHAVLVSCVVVPASMLTVFCATEWGALITVLLWQLASWGGPTSIGPFIALYFVGALAVTVFEIWLAGALVGRVARNFDAYAVGEGKVL